MLCVKKAGGVFVRVLKQGVVHGALIADFHSRVHINTEALNKVLADAKKS